MLTNLDILHRLRRGGIAIEPARLRAESRKDCTVVQLNGERIAWFPESAEARVRIENERRILQLIEKYCTYRAPRIVYADAEGWDVRAIVPGVAAPDFLHQIETNPGAAQRVGAGLGRILAEQHSRIPAYELGSWLTRVSPWPPLSAIENVPKVIDDGPLLMRIDRALARGREIARNVPDPVLLHCDLGPWNLAVNPATGELQGVFDYGDAAFGDRHQDFKYMLFHRLEEQVLLDAAIEAYEHATNIILDRERITFFNAIEAINFLGFRFGHPPDESPCGRTLAEDLEWTHAALTASGF